ncbi:hypothetical protein [Mycoplasma sp. P36-A1]|uniref:hypothetical protein n=1 Tax=Mycoplasma sp. P36-A1 TaxID=3252900 RepID=UPI003C2D9ED0
MEKQELLINLNDLEFKKIIAIAKIKNLNIEETVISLINDFDLNEILNSELNIYMNKLYISTGILYPTMYTIKNVQDLIKYIVTIPTIKNDEKLNYLKNIEEVKSEKEAKKLLDQLIIDYTPTTTVHISASQHRKLELEQDDLNKYL